MSFAPRYKQWLVFLVFAGAAARLLAAAMDAHDFTVYWLGARAWLDGANPYLVRPELPGMVFKYPPWILPLFAPWALLPLEAAKLAWGALELLAVAYCARWVGGRAALWAAAPLWWIWLGHFHAGQITLFLLAAMLWAFDRRERGGAVGAALFLATSKVFSVLSFAGLARQARWARAALVAAVLVGLAHGVLLLRPTPIGELYRGWRAAAEAGGAELGAEIVRGPANHGLTALVLRTAGVAATDVRADGLVALVIFTGLVAAWIWASRRARLDARETWAGWIAAGLLAHPLAWHHSFVLAYPLAALALARAMREGSRARLVAVGVGLTCIGAILPQTVGSAIAEPLEMLGLKAWGVLACAGALAWPRSVRR